MSLSTIRPPLKAAIGVSICRGSTSISMPRGGRPLVRAKSTPAWRRLRTAATASSVRTLSWVTSVPSTSARKRRMGGAGFGWRVVGSDGPMVGAAARPRVMTARMRARARVYPMRMAHNDIPTATAISCEGDFLTLATVGEDGYPQVSEVWFVAEGDQVAMSLNTRRQKVKNLETEPACTVLLLDLQNPYRYLEIRGTAVVAPDEDRAFAELVGAKYNADLREHDAPGDRRVVVRIVPVHVNAVDMSG